MATSFNKTYTITLKFTYVGERAITDADMNVAVLRAKIIKRIAEECGHMNQGDLNAHIVGSVTEA